jgi:hypothetical protein
MLPTLARDDAIDGFVDAAVDAEGQAVAGGVDRVDDLVEFVGLPAQHVQDAGPNFLVQAVQARNLVGARREEGAVLGAFASVPRR